MKWTDFTSIIRTKIFPKFVNLLLLKSLLKATTPHKTVFPNRLCLKQAVSTTFFFNRKPCVFEMHRGNFFRAFSCVFVHRFVRFRSFSCVVRSFPCVFRVFSVRFRTASPCSLENAPCTVSLSWTLCRAKQAKLNLNASSKFL